MNPATDATFRTQPPLLAIRMGATAFMQWTAPLKLRRKYFSNPANRINFNGAVEVEAEVLLEPRQSHLVERGEERGGACIVHQDIDGAELGDRVVNQALDLSDLGDVGGDRQCPPALALDLLHGLLEVLTTSRGEGHAGAGRAERPGDGLPDALARTRDDGRLVLEHRINHAFAANPPG